MKHYNFKPIANDKIVVGINIDILNIRIKKCKLHILPSLILIYSTIDGYVTFDLDWLIFELRLYIVYKYIRDKWKETKNKCN